jgi:hypothetical protein
MRRAPLVAALGFAALAAPASARAAFDRVPEVFGVGVEIGDVAQADVDEGCAGGTTGRKLLRYALRARNVGADDLVLGDPGCPDCEQFPGAPCANPLFVCSLSHGHPHFESFAQAQLRDGNGVVRAQSRKVSFCLIDTECAAPQFTTCGYQGITAGCADVYDAGLPCQYIDLTDAPIGPGPYTMRVTLDPDGRLAEGNESNNVVQQTVRVDCPALPGAWGACALDPFLCYRVRATTAASKLVPIAPVALVDPTESMAVGSARALRLHAPADANGEGVVDPETHLAAYAMKPVQDSPPYAPHRRPDRERARVARRRHAAAGAGARPDGAEPGRSAGAARAGARRPLRLPAREDVARDAALAKGLQVTVANEFTTPAKLLEIRKLRRLCTPVDMNGAGIRNAAASLVCYTTRPASGEPKHPGVAGIFVTNDLESARVDTRRETDVCLPSVVNPPSDDCADPLAVASFPATFMQDTSGATTAPDDPVLSCGTQSQKSHSVWLAFTASGNGTVTADTAGSDYDTALAAFTGACGALIELACNDDYGGVTSRIAFPVAAGAAYRLEVTSYDATPAGTAVVNVSFAP